MSGASQWQDLSGNTYGRLTVISFSHKKARKSYFNCECECGNKIVTRSDMLKSGNTKSCGCYHLDQITKGTEQDRFWAYVDKSGDCWEWQASKSQRGYGQFSATVGGRLRNMRAHRLAYIWSGNDLQDDDILCHTCDNPSCVNPDHLFVGTHQDNMADKVAKERQAKGEDIAVSILTEAQVHEIRRRFASGESGPTIADDFGVTKQCVYSIAKRKTWRHI
ncbi:MAG: hypothetical protein GY820_11040 [Gammaproteobacteria bacterium]|nr:hypothetical protein [Gammaproteobacteria bacterium]